jgi:DNA-binding NtrC family response regulator
MKERFDSLVEQLIASGFFLEEAVEILEKNMIAQAMHKTGGNQSAASKLLGIHRNTLQRKIDAYQLIRKPVRRAAATKRKTKAG